MRLVASSRSAVSPAGYGPAGGWLKGVGPEPAPGTPPREAPSSDSTVAPARALHCARCGHAITSDAHRMQVAGQHAHVRDNPSGLVFLFGCFSRADGCVVSGEPTLEHTWFAGFTWQFAHCSACFAHLGWYFAGEGAFFGLVLDRLIEPP